MNNYNEPWRSHETVILFPGGGGFNIGNCDDSIKKSSRIVACVNACAGLTDEDLEDSSMTILQHMEDQYAEKIAKLTHQRDVAWEELKQIRAVIPANPEESTYDEVCRIVHQALNDAASARIYRDAFIAMLAVCMKELGYTEEGWKQYLESVVDDIPENVSIEQVINSAISLDADQEGFNPRITAPDGRVVEFISSENHGVVALDFISDSEKEANDSKRYQWLIANIGDNKSGFNPLSELCGFDMPGEVWRDPTKSEIDSAIDAALTRENSNG